MWIKGLKTVKYDQKTLLTNILVKKWSMLSKVLSSMHMHAGSWQSTREAFEFSLASRVLSQLPKWIPAGRPDFIGTDPNFDFQNLQKSNRPGQFSKISAGTYCSS